MEACARFVEADVTDTSVGRGGLPKIDGTVELDASIMDGSTRQAGAVAALVGFHHPITVARAVMERSPHVLLVGDGAARFASEIGAERIRNLTTSTRRLWIEQLRRVRQTPATVRRSRKLLPIVERVVAERFGTVNFIAIDRKGDVASAVTTSGWGYSYPGRVGDSPIIGAGNYCATGVGGACCTGFGELAQRELTAKAAVDRLGAGMAPRAVARRAIADALVLSGAPFNIVVLAADGTHAAASNRAGRRYAFMTAAMDEPEVLPRAIVRMRPRGRA